MSQAINLGDMNFRILVETISDIILIADLEAG